MSKPLSPDLRKRLVSAVLDEGMSRNRAAARFDVGISTVVNLVRRFLETGSVAPGKIGGYREKHIRDEHEVFLRQRVQAGNFTIRGLVGELADRGVKTNYRTVWEFVHAEKQSFKKNRSRQRTGPARRGASARSVAQISKSH